MLIVDAHLDLAYNAVRRGRDLRRLAKEQATIRHDAAYEEIATVGLPDLRAGNVGLVCATIFCEPKSANAPDGYTDSEGAREQAFAQVNWYREQCDAGLMRMVRSAGDLPSSETCDASALLPFILLLEGADAIRSPADVAEWFDAGVRIVGLSWKRTRYAGGTGEPGPLTSEGVELVHELDRFGIIHDASHLAEESFWHLTELSRGPIIASHSNSRSIVGEGDRHLTDDMIRAIVARGGVIGINFFDRFLLPNTGSVPSRRATLHDVFNHVKHIANLTGSANHVGLGTDMDGGLGQLQIPREILTAGDLPKVGEALSEFGLPPMSVKDVMGRNWLRYFREHLPA